MRPANVFAAAIPLTLLLGTSSARAVEVPNVGGKPLTFDITNTSIFDYHFNNRNDTPLNVPTQVDDFYGEWLDRLNVQASWWRFRLGLRIDANVYYHHPDRGTVADLVADQANIEKARGKAPDDYTADFYRELHTRFLRAIYPSKLFAAYEQPGVEVTVGDFYVQLGRGLVFSVRKIDELAVDTTVRGGKVVLDKDFGKVRLGATLFGGQMNPLRIDETSGRRLHGTNDGLFFGFPMSGDLETYQQEPGKVLTVLTPARPSYLEDTALGGSLELGTDWFTVTGNTAVLLRKDYKGFTSNDPSKEHDRIINASGSINVPSIMKHRDLYLEVAGQQMTDPNPEKKTLPNLSGYAIYASASITGGPVSVSLEGKHYRNFFPLSAHIDTTTPGFSAPEFALVTYSQPPTAEPIYTDVVGGGSPNVCISGGRGRVDFRFNREASVYAWLGRYASWSEIPGDLSQGCQINSASLTNIWDTAAGVDLGFEHGKTHVKAWVGARTSTYAEQPVNADGTIQPGDFYHEGYIRYDVIKHLGGRFSLQLQGFHRHRFEPISFTKPWTEGENYTALQWSPHLSAIVGYEYLAKEQCQPARPATLTQPARDEKDVCHYVNGGIQWRAAGIGDKPAAKYTAQLFDSVALFVGQRRPALRCISGVCRQFPAFEGARIEITSRF